MALPSSSTCSRPASHFNLEVVATLRKLLVWKYLCCFQRWLHILDHSLSKHMLTESILEYFTVPRVICQTASCRLLQRQMGKIFLHVQTKVNDIHMKQKVWEGWTKVKRKTDKVCAKHLFTTHLIQIKTFHWINQSGHRLTKECK